MSSLMGLILVCWLQKFCSLVKLLCPVEWIKKGDSGHICKYSMYVSIVSHFYSFWEFPHVSAKCLALESSDFVLNSLRRSSQFNGGELLLYLVCRKHMNAAVIQVISESFEGLNLLMFLQNALIDTFGPVWRHSNMNSMNAWCLCKTWIANMSTDWRAQKQTRGALSGFQLHRIRGPWANTSQIPLLLLHTPCGCNSWVFRAESLHGGCWRVEVEMKTQHGTSPVLISSWKSLVCTCVTADSKQRQALLCPQIVRQLGCGGCQM